MSEFNFNGFNLEVDTGENGDAWFVAKEVCDILGISNPSKAINGENKRLKDGKMHRVGGLDDDEKAMRIANTPGGPQRVLCVNEFGIYKLVMKSHKEEAKPFQRWVTHEVLPSIKRDGMYSLEKTSQELSPELKMFGQMYKVMAKNELRLNKVENSLKQIKKAVSIGQSEDPKAWRVEANQVIRDYGTQLGGQEDDYRRAYHTVYDEVERRGHFNLDARVRNLKKRMTQAGMPKSQVKSLSRLDAISSNVQLREIFISVVKDLGIQTIEE